MIDLEASAIVCNILPSSWPSFCHKNHMFYHRPHSSFTEGDHIHFCLKQCRSNWKIKSIARFVNFTFKRLLNQGYKYCLWYISFSTTSSINSPFVFFIYTYFQIKNIPSKGIILSSDNHTFINNSLEHRFPLI